MKSFPGRMFSSLLAAAVPLFTVGCRPAAGPASASGPAPAAAWNQSSPVTLRLNDPAKGARELRVETANGDISVTPGSGEQVDGQARVTAHGPYPPASLQSWASQVRLVTRKGDTLVVKAEPPTGVPRDVSFS